MDTRRDQLQLLEHFISAINGDSARPQIAQLTELGLVELTRKRQGQNIYELFRKTSPDSLGKSDLQQITIEDINPTISTEAKVNNSSLILDKEIEFVKGNSIKKKNINKAKDNEISSINEEYKSSNDTLKHESSQLNVDNISATKNQKKQEKIIINVTMSDQEENVYSRMGLDPILLLDESREHENYTVHIIRPGEEEGIEEGENNKNIIRVKSKKTLEQEPTSLEEAETLHGEEAYVDLEEVKNDLIITDKISINEKNELNTNESKKVDEDPRRKRRRSSASS